VGSPKKGCPFSKRYFMKIKPKFPLRVRIGKDGECEENVGRMLVRARLAEEIIQKQQPKKYR